MGRKILGFALVLILIFVPVNMTAASTDIADIIVREIAAGLEYDWIAPFSEGLAMVVIDNAVYPPDRPMPISEYYKNGKVGFIDKTGTVIIPVEYDVTPYSDFLVFGGFGWGNFSEGLAAMSKDGKCGFIDKTGKVILPFEYDFAENFAYGLARVQKDGKEGFIDKTGDFVFLIDEYDSVNNFYEGLAAVWKYAEKSEWGLSGGKWGFIDTTGTVAIPIEYDTVNSFSDGLAFAVQDDKQGFIDKTGEFVIQLENISRRYIYYGITGYFENGLAVIQENEKKYNYIDKTGAVILSVEYELAYNFYEGLAGVLTDRRDEKWGFIDITGKEVIPCIYDDAMPWFSDGVANVSKDGKWGYIDTSGNTVVPFIYDYSQSFSEGLACVNKDDKWSILEISASVSEPPLTAAPTESISIFDKRQ